MLGNRIRFNYFHDNERGSPDHNAGNCTIYLDNSTHGVEVFGNVFYRNIGRTVKPWSCALLGITEGHDHVIANNLFIDNPGVKTKDGADFEKTRKTYLSNVTMLTKDVDVTAPPYSTTPTRRSTTASSTTRSSATTKASAPRVIPTKTTAITTSRSTLIPAL
jgi:hypothetical protein